MTHIYMGLGNKGEKYAHTRHNIGWATLDTLKNSFEASEFKEDERMHALIAEAKVDGEKILFVKPLTFMNLSGECASALQNYYKLGPSDFTILYDDIDLPLGEVRYRKEGSPGTHNGMKSVVHYLGTNVPRLRLGIENRPPELKAKIDLSDYVLNRFTAQEETAVEKMLSEGVEILLRKKTAME